VRILGLGTLLFFAACTSSDDLQVVDASAPPAVDATPVERVPTSWHLEGPYVGAHAENIGCHMNGDWLTIDVKDLDTDHPKHSQGPGAWISACDPLEGDDTLWRLHCRWRVWQSSPWPLPWDWSDRTIYLQKNPDPASVVQGAYVWWVDGSCGLDREGFPCSWPNEPFYTCEYVFVIETSEVTY
jgi:hypothetical protein